MTDDPFEQPPGATPLRPEEKAALRVPVLNRAQLNALEATNVADGRVWAMASRRDCFVPAYMTALHRRMFGDVWKWVGKYRTHDVEMPASSHYYEVQVHVIQTFDDARAWLEYNAYDPIELAVRLHHRLVKIHPFSGGNGRCTRLIADVVIKRFGAKPLTWGSASLMETGPARDAYIAALRAADEHDLGPLLAFAQS
jgi:Fic-DOC domain mobile mystery protein B